jgi:acetyl-CoA acetyltransferase
MLARFNGCGGRRGVSVRDVFLVGVGSTPFGQSGRSAADLLRDALTAAIADAGLTRREIGAIATAVGDRDAQDTSGLPALGPPCAAAAQALQHGWQAVATGEHDVVVCAGVQTLWSGRDQRAVLTTRAQAAERYMSLSGATPGDLALVVAKNSAQGAENPRAPLAHALGAAEVLGSELLADPLRRLMVAEPSDGAAAVVLAASDRRHGPGPRALRIRASVLVGGPSGGGQADGGGQTDCGVGQAGRLAYQAAGIGPEDIDLAEIDDATAAGELMSYEALQFAPEGHGPELVAGGFTALGGVLPVNVSGGMLSQGEAVAASGIAQVCELAWQLRRQAGRRQVAGARIGLACNAGPGEDGEALVSLTILAAG